MFAEKQGSSRLDCGFLPGNASNPWGLPDCEGLEKDMKKRRSCLFFHFAIALITQCIPLPGYSSLTDTMGWSRDLGLFVPLPL